MNSLPEEALANASTRDVIYMLEKLGCEVTDCGSRVTCDPPPSGTDWDRLVACKDDDSVVAEVVSVLYSTGFAWEGDSEHYQVSARGGFMSWRRGEDNFIVIADAQLVRRHKAATALCRRLNLMAKADRIAVFQVVLYGKEWAGSDAVPA